METKKNSAEKTIIVVEEDNAAFVGKVKQQFGDDVIVVNQDELSEDIKSKLPNQILDIPEPTKIHPYINPYSEYRQTPELSGREKRRIRREKERKNKFKF